MANEPLLSAASQCGNCGSNVFVTASDGRRLCGHCGGPFIEPALPYTETYAEAGTSTEREPETDEEHLEAAVRYIESGHIILAEDHAKAILLRNPAHADAWLCIAMVDFEDKRRLADTLKAVEDAVLAGATEPVRRRIAAGVLRPAEKQLGIDLVSHAIRYLQLSYATWPLESLVQPLSRAWKIHLLNVARPAKRDYFNEETKTSSQLIELSLLIRREQPQWRLDLPTAAVQQIDAVVAAEQERANAEQLRVNAERQRKEYEAAQERSASTARRIFWIMLAAGFVVQVIAPSTRYSPWWFAYNAFALAVLFARLVPTVVAVAPLTLLTWAVMKIIEAIH